MAIMISSSILDSSHRPLRLRISEKSFGLKEKKDWENINLYFSFQHEKLYIKSAASQKFCENNFVNWCQIWKKYPK